MMRSGLMLFIADLEYFEYVYGRNRPTGLVPPGEWTCGHMPEDDAYDHADGCRHTLHVNDEWAVYAFVREPMSYGSSKTELRLTGDAWCPNCIRKEGLLIADELVREVYIALRIRE